jgi:hypothetical protein
MLLRPRIAGADRPVVSPVSFRHGSFLFRPDGRRYRRHCDWRHEGASRCVESGLGQGGAAWNKSPQLEGEVSGFPVKVDFHKRGSGNAKSVWTRFKLGVPFLPGGLELKREGFLSGISRVFGVHDIEVGDEAFDSQVLVKGHNKGAILDFLTPDRRTDIRRFLESHSGAVIDGDGISWSSRGRMRDSARVLATVNEMRGLARALTGAPEQREEDSGILDDAMAILAAPVAASAVAAELELAPVAELAPAPTAELEPARAVAAELEPTAVLESEPEIEPAVKAGPAVEPIVETESEPTTEAEVAATEAADVGTAATPAGSADSLDVAAFCAAVFAPGALSFEATRRFEQGYRGQRVAWTGTLKAAEPYRFDFVFGSGPGVKATLALDTATAVDREIKAVIALPDGSEDLQQRIGEPLEFSGTLLKVDGFGGNVFLTEARLP